MTTETVFAFKWDGKPSFTNAPAWLRDAKERGAVRTDVINAPAFALLIPDTEAIYRCAPGDYVLRVGGKIRPMAKAAFEAEYVQDGFEPEPVQDVAPILQKLVDSARLAGHGGRTIVTMADVERAVSSAAHPLVPAYRRRLPVAA